MRNRVLGVGSAMAETSAPRARAPARSYVHEELVPLGQACAAAYHVLVEEGPKAARDIAEARGLLAVTLARVATLYRMTDGAPEPLGEAEIRESLLADNPDLHNLYIRRGALLGAVETLKTVRLL